MLYFFTMFSLVKFVFPLPFFSDRIGGLLLVHLIMVVCWFLFLSKNYFRIFFGFLALLSLAYGTAINSRYLNYPFNLNWERTIFVDNRAQEIRLVYAKDATYLPYRLREIAYGNWIVIIRWFRNIASFIEIKNFSDTFGLLFFLPFLWGLKRASKFEILAFVITLFVVGIGKTSDRFNGLFFGWPLWLSVIWRKLKEFC